MAATSNMMIYSDSRDRLLQRMNTLDASKQTSIQLLTQYLDTHPHNLLPIERQAEGLHFQLAVINHFHQLLDRAPSYKPLDWKQYQPVNLKQKQLWSYTIPLLSLGVIACPLIALFAFKLCCLLTAIGLIAAATLPLSMTTMAMITVITVSMILTPLISIGAFVTSIMGLTNLHERCIEKSASSAALANFKHGIANLAEYCQGILSPSANNDDGIDNAYGQTSIPSAGFFYKPAGSVEANGHKTMADPHFTAQPPRSGFPL